MAAKHDYYKTLQLEREASDEEVKKAYRKLARKYHPDLNPGDKGSEERFKAVQEAYDVLSDAGKRQIYDHLGYYSATGAPPGGAAHNPGMGFGGFDFEQMARNRAGGRGRAGADGGGFGDLFSQFFRRGAEPEHVPEKGSDLEYALNITFGQAIRGTQSRLNVMRQEVCGPCGGTGTVGHSTPACPQCNGKGTVSQMAGAMRFDLSCPRCNGRGKLANACTACHGEGRAARTESVEIRIPPGAKSGSRLRVAGKGNSGTMGGVAGDLYITTRVEPHPFFTREGDDIEIQVPVTVSEAGLGAKIEVPTIDGRTTLKVPQGTQNRQRFRLREKGVHNPQKNRRGDQIVEVYIQPPPSGDERTREILRELAQLHPEDPREDVWAKAEI
jgi:molecular chaperone DnaJ